MTEAMPFLQKTILLSYDPRPLVKGAFLCKDLIRYRKQKRKACRQRRSRENAVLLEYAKKASVWMPFCLVEISGIEPLTS